MVTTRTIATRCWMPLDSCPGYYFDDTRRCIEALGLTSSDRANVFEFNVRRVYP